MDVKIKRTGKLELSMKSLDLLKNLSPIGIKEIQKIFSKLSITYGWNKVYENKNIIELRKNGSSITLEPEGR